MKKRIVTLALSAAMLLSTVAPISALEKMDRIKGENNYDTASKIARTKEYTSVILVNMDKGVADGLSASALAGAKNGVILYTKKDSMPAETRTRLAKATDVYLIGSENAISKSVEDDLIRMDKKVTRIGGDDRYETSYKVAKEVLESEIILDKVFIANGLKGEADIVSVSPVAYRDKAPILLTDGNTIETELKDVANAASNRFIIGGTTVVKDSVKNGLNKTERISGNDRFATNQKLVEKFYSNPREFNIVESTDYAMATVASSISTEKPIALVDGVHNPVVLKNAEKLTYIGNVSDNSLEKAVLYTGGLNKSNYAWTKNRYIAHALGGVGGKTYTNSPQALEHNYNKGFKVFEVDLDFTSDDELIAWHSFERNSLKEMGLPERYATKKPTLEEFKSQKSYGKYNTMTFKDIVAYMENYKDIYVVIDLKQAEVDKVRKLYKRIVEEASPEILDRIIPQVYGEDSYYAIKAEYDFKSMAYTCYTMRTVDPNWLTRFCVINGINVITVDYRYATSSLIEKCKSKGITVYMNTINNKNEENKYKGKGVYGFFTDFLTP